MARCLHKGDTAKGTYMSAVLERALLGFVEVKKTAALMTITDQHFNPASAKINLLPGALDEGLTA